MTQSFARRRGSQFCGAAVAVLLLAGCGGGDGGPTEPSGSVASVRVTPASDVEIVNGAPTVSVGDSAEFEASATDQAGRPVSTNFSWTSLDPTVATLDDSGTAVGVGPGETGIVAAASNGVSDTVTLVVRDADGPNLRASSLDLLPRGILAGASVEAEVIVRNTGEEAGAFRFTVSEGSAVLTSGQREGLAAGATDTIELSGLGPFATGVHLLTLEVDTEDEVVESDESDNVTTSRLESHPSGYEIEFQFVGGVSQVLRSTVLLKGGRWSEAIVGDVDDVSFDSLSIDDCFSESRGLPARTEAVDDMLILVTEDSIDGAGGILARAGPCFVRTESTDPDRPPLPLVGVMEFDRADVEQARADETLEDIVFHEMGHVLGFGTLWNFQGNDGQGPYQLLTGRDSPDPRFLGPFAIREYRSIGGADARVPVEGLPAGPGTRNSHWRESVFDDELMTGFIAPGSNPLSVVTIASLADMFYAVDLSAADPFTLDGGGAASIRRGGVELGADHIRSDLPLFGVERDGTVHRLLPPAGGSVEQE